MASSGLTAALIALLYTGIKIIQRSRCSSHNSCCDFSISRAETERQERSKNAELVEMVLKQLRAERAMEEEPEGEQLV